MPNVKFNLDKPSSKEKTLVLLKFSYLKRQFRYTTGKKIYPKFWNFKDQKAKGSKDFPEYVEFNAILKRLAGQADKVFDRFMLNDKIPSKQEFKEALDIETGRKERREARTLFSFIEEFIAIREKLPTFQKNTIKTYKSHYENLKDYAKTKRITLDFNDITLEFYDNFLLFLYNEKEFAIGTAGNIIKTLKTVLNDATEKGINKNLAFRNKKFKKPTFEPENIYLNEKELAEIYNYNLSNNPRLDKVRDLFIIGCFTGLRISDFTLIKPANIKRIYDENGNGYEVIKKMTKKTTTPVTIPIHPYVKEILNKYNNLLPAPISDQKMNDYIKELMKLVGINEKITLKKSRAGKIESITSEKWEEVASHTARRSFANNAYKNGIPSLSIMAITGHKSEKAFRRYIIVRAEEHAIIMAKNRFYTKSNLKVV